MQRTYRYEGEAPMNGVTLRDGTQTLLHKGKEYQFDDEEPFVKNLLGKRDAKGFARPWLVIVSPPPATTAPPPPLQDENEENETTDTQQKRKK